MSSEKNDFLTVLETNINHDIEIEDLGDITNKFNLSGVLKTNSERFFDFVINNKHSIKAIFDDEVLRQYLENQEDTDINQLNSKNKAN